MKRIIYTLITLMMMSLLVSGCQNRTQVSQIEASLVENSSSVAADQTGLEEQESTEEVLEPQAPEPKETEAATESPKPESSVDEGQNAPVEAEEVDVEATTEADTSTQAEEVVTKEPEQVTDIVVSIEGPLEVGTLWSGTYDYIEEETAFEALLRISEIEGFYVDAVGRGNTAYIKGIGDYYEFDYGPMSGWLYSVNDEFPTYGSGGYTLEAGDSLTFIYSED